MDLSTFTWALGLCLVIGALGWWISGPLLTVGGVGVVLIAIGLAADLGGN